MSYLTSEQSTHDSAPIELYEFRRGVISYTYTSSDEDVEFRAAIYKAEPLSRSALETSGEVGRSSIRLSMPRDAVFLLDYRIAPPSEVTTLTIYRKHRGRPDDEAIVIWIGRMLSLKWEGSLIELECEPVFTSIRRLGLRRKYSRACGHVLYGPACGVNATAFKGTGAVIGQSGNVIAVNIAGDNGDNYYSGGYIQYDFDGRKEKKMILRQVGTSLVLAGIPTGLAGGDAIELFPGCDHTLATCKAKFNNILNYGGFPWIPTKNPFNSTPLW